MKRVHDSELQFIAKHPWAGVDASPIAAELLLFRNRINSLEKAAWALTEELITANKEMGTDRPAELKNVYARLHAVEDALLYMRELRLATVVPSIWEDTDEDDGA